jgi:UDP-N-acetylglucosamine--N-acetylmuramyl-(pentapeptide) pyrophosphoryl-undecaprenol N-acetylglucosamine transferase
MRLVVTGGGTGGHVYPALEVARQALARGWEVRYIGSLRGQEGPACAAAGIPFVGFPAEPLYSLRRPRGWRAAVNLLRATGGAKTSLRANPADVVFSTGGYAGAPVMNAARSLGVPYVIHEQNSVPGRSNLLFSKAAFAVATTFHAASKHFPGCRVERTGMPVREDLRQSASRSPQAAECRVLVVGGSQGAVPINQAALGTAQRMTCPGVRWLHQAGPANFEAVYHSLENLGIASCYDVKPFFEGKEMGEAYAWASLVVGRSGAGTLTELAAFGLPSVLVPYPLAYGKHQHHNAKEFEEMGAAKVIDQGDLQPASLESALRVWQCDDEAVERARIALRNWDVPDAAAKILSLVEAAAAS